MIRFSYTKAPDTHSYTRGFTLIELLVVIAIVGVLSLVVILVINPADLLRQSRDTNRLSDMDTLNHALNLYQGDVTISPSFGNASTTYFSLIDTTATSTTGTNCAGIGGLTPPTNWIYHCAASSTLRNVDGTGWVPVNFTSMSFGTALGSLPIDPVNTSSSGQYYSYTPGGSWALATSMESQKYLTQRAAQDGGSDPGRYETGSDLSLVMRSEGLVGWWTFDEGSSTAATDRSGNGNVGTWSGTGTHYTTPKMGSYAGGFDGSTDYINIPDATSLQLTSAGTVSAWVYPTAYAPGAGWRVILTKGNWGGGFNNYSIYYQNSNTSLTCEVDSGVTQSFALAQTITPLNTWTHVAMTWNGSQIIAYINGVNASSRNMASNPNTSTYPLQIGANGGGGAKYSGSEDDVRIYNRALSAAEIAAIYNATK